MKVLFTSLFSVGAVLTTVFTSSLTERLIENLPHRVIAIAGSSMISSLIIYYIVVRSSETHNRKKDLFLIRESEMRQITQSVPVATLHDEFIMEKIRSIAQNSQNQIMTISGGYDVSKYGKYMVNVFKEALERNVHVTRFHPSLESLHLSYLKENIDPLRKYPHYQIRILKGETSHIQLATSEDQAIILTGSDDSSQLSAMNTKSQKFIKEIWQLKNNLLTQSYDISASKLEEIIEYQEVLREIVLALGFFKTMLRDSKCDLPSPQKLFSFCHKQNRIVRDALGIEVLDFYLYEKIIGSLQTYHENLNAKIKRKQFPLDRLTEWTQETKRYVEFLHKRLCDGESAQSIQEELYIVLGICEGGV